MGALNCPALHSENCLHFHPFVTSQGDQRTGYENLRPLFLPDLVPNNAIPAPGLLSFRCGEFLSSMKDLEEAEDSDIHAVMCCFFLDTAHNIAAYIRCIARVLKPGKGGILMSVGPLEWHYSEQPH